MARYGFAYQVGTVYEQVVDLVGATAAPPGVLVDIGCGHGAVAEPLREMGFDYVGLDVDPEAVEALRRRGFEATRCDLGDPDDLARALDVALADRDLAGLVMLDCLEHLVDGPRVLQELQAFSRAHGSPPLVVSVPNVTHVDLGIKLLLGRWDYTEVGLLDDTHVAFFSEQRLREVTVGAGWIEVAVADFVLVESDQHFPAGHPALRVGTALHRHLLGLREQAGVGAVVNQWVRAYRPGAQVRPRPRSPGPSPALSVLVPVTGPSEQLDDLLLCLSAQDDGDVEMLVLVHGHGHAVRAVRRSVDALCWPEATEVTVVEAPGTTFWEAADAGLERARGDYVTVLADTDLVDASWSRQLIARSRSAAGQVVRTPVASQPVLPLTGTWSPRGHLSAVAAVEERGDGNGGLPVDLLGEAPLTPALAWPREGVRLLDARLAGGPAAHDDLPPWLMTLRLGLVVGVLGGGHASALTRRLRRAGEGLPSARDQLAARRRLLTSTAQGPVLLPPSELVRLMDALGRSLAEREELEICRAELRALRAEPGPGPDQAPVAG